MAESGRAARTRPPQPQQRALRTQALAISIALLCEFLIGMAVNLDATIPATDRGSGIVPAIARAVSHGPASLAVHAVLGLVIVVGSLAAAIRGISSRSPVLAVPAMIGLLCMVGASVSGASFVGSQDAAASMAMAACTALALGCYAIILFALASPGHGTVDSESAGVRERRALTNSAPQPGGG